jgi:hypothetical protein
MPHGRPGEDAPLPGRGLRIRQFQVFGLAASITARLGIWPISPAARESIYAFTHCLARSSAHAPLAARSKPSSRRARVKVIAALDTFAATRPWTCRLARAILTLP